MTEASTGIKNAVRYYGDSKHRGAHMPLNYALLEDLDKTSDARDVKFAVDKWLTYKPLRKPANWVVSYSYGCHWKRFIIIIILGGAGYCDQPLKGIFLPGRCCAWGQAWSIRRWMDVVFRYANSDRNFVGAIQDFIHLCVTSVNLWLLVRPIRVASIIIMINPMYSVIFCMSPLKVLLMVSLLLSLLLS